MKRHTSVLLGILLVASSVLACAPAATPGASTENTASAPEASAFPFGVTDSLGRLVTVSARPARVVSLAPSLTEILFAVGAGDQVVGVTSWCNYPPEATTRDQVGGFTAETISVEKVVAMKPDLVLANGAIHQSVIDLLDAVNVLVVSVDPNSINEVYEGIQLIGRLTGHVEEATAVVTDMRTRIDQVAATVSQIPESERLTVFWEVWDEPLMTAGPNTYAGSMITLAGGINIFGDVDQEYPEVSTEEVVTRNPQVLMAPYMIGEELTLEEARQRPGWEGIDAVRNGRVHLIDGDIVSREGPRLADAVEAVAKALYPELFQ